MAERQPQDSFRFEREMAIAILKQQDAAALRALKRFLLNMPAPKAIETVLGQAVCGCAEECPDAFDWIFANAGQLEPELLLEQWAYGLVANYLGPQGCLMGQAFYLKQQSDQHQLQLHLEGDARQFLQERCSEGEWLLLHRLFLLT